MVYDYLAAMGYEDPARVQQEAANSDLSCLIRFYSGELGGTSGAAAAAAGGCLVWFRLIDVPAELVDIPLWVRPAREAVVPEEKGGPSPQNTDSTGSAETRYLLRVSGMVGLGGGGGGEVGWWAASSESPDLFKFFNATFSFRCLFNHQI